MIIFFIANETYHRKIQKPLANETKIISNNEYFYVVLRRHHWQWQSRYDGKDDNDGEDNENNNK